MKEYNSKMELTALVVIRRYLMGKKRHVAIPSESKMKMITNENNNIRHRRAVGSDHVGQGCADN